MPIEVAGVVARLGFKVDDDGANRFERKLHGLRGDASKPVVAPLKGEIQGKDLELYDSKLTELREKTKRRDAFKAKLGADFDQRAFNSYERESRRAIKATDDNVRAQGRLRTAFGSVSSAGVGVFAAAGGGYAIYAGLKSITGAAGEAEVSQQKLETQVTALGRSYRAHAEEIDRVIQKTSLLAGIDDEDLADAFTSIARTSGSVKDGLEGIGIAADIARARHMDVAKAGDLVGKVFAGNFTALKRYGIVLDENATKEEAIAAIQQKFAGQARAYGRTQTGAVERLSVAWENLRENLGQKLAPTITRVANRLARFVTEMTEGRGQGGRFVDTLKDIWEQIKRVADRVLDVGRFLKDHTGLVKAAAGAWLAYKGAMVAAAAVSKGQAVVGMLRGGAGRAAGGAAGAAGAGALGGPVGVGLAVGATAVIAAGQVNRFSRDQRAAEATLKFQQQLLELIRSAPKDYERLRGVLDKVSKQQALTREENELYTRSLHKAGIEGSTSTKRLLDSWADLRKSAEKTFKGDELREYRKHVRTTVDTAVEQWDRLRKRHGTDFSDIRETTRTTGRFIRQQLPEDTAQARKAVSDNFKRAADQVQKQMDRAGKQTKEGSRLIRQYTIQGLKALGLTQGQAESKVDRGTIQTRRGPQADAARGGVATRDGRVRRDGGGWIGAPGQIGMDTIPAMLAPGEAVLNRHQQAVIEGMLGGGFLDRLFARVSTPHYMAKGGMVAAANRLDRAHFPYVWGGGHSATPAPFGPMDCSGAVSYVLQQGGVSIPTMTSGQLMRAGKSGPGEVTVYANPEHTLMSIGDRFFGTSASNPGGGAGWFPNPGAGYLARFVARHFTGGAGLAVPRIPRFATDMLGGAGAMVNAGLDRIRSGGQDRIRRAWASLGVGLGNQNNPAIGGPARGIARRMLGSFGFGPGQFDSLDPLWTGESGWNQFARNRSSGAYGIPQALPGSKMAAAGADWRTNPATQIRWGLGYIRDRYGSPAAAYRAWLSRSPHWYARGGRAAGGVLRLASGGRAGAVGAHEQGTAQEQAALGAARSAYSIGRQAKRQNRRVKRRIRTYDSVIDQIEGLATDYEIKDRQYGRSEEVFIRDDGTLDQAAVQRRVDELDDLITIRQRIAELLENSVKIARRVVKTYRTILRRLRRSLRHAKRKDRSGIRAQITDVRGEISTWADTVTSQSKDARFAREDLADIVAERDEVKGTRAPAPDTSGGGETGGGADTGSTADADAIAAQATARAERLAADLATVRANFAAFTSTGDLGSGQGSTALGSALVDAAGGVGGANAAGIPGAFLAGGTVTVIVNSQSLVPGSHADNIRTADAITGALGVRPVRPVTQATVG